MPAGAFYGQEATMPAATQARQVHLWGQEGVFYGQEATMPVRCIFMVKTGAFYGQKGAFYGQEASEWNQNALLSWSTTSPG